MDGQESAQNRRNEKIPGSIQELGLTPQSSGDLLIWYGISPSRIIGVCACKKLLVKVQLADREDTASKAQYRLL